MARLWAGPFLSRLPLRSAFFPPAVFRREKQGCLRGVRRRTLLHAAVTFESPCTNEHRHSIVKALGQPLPAEFTPLLRGVCLAFAWSEQGVMVYPMSLLFPCLGEWDEFLGKFSAGCQILASCEFTFVLLKR